MVYHDILGIQENASTHDIDCAYEVKIAALDEHRLLMDQQAYDKKACELHSAKVECLAWRDKNFVARTTEKVRGYSSDLFDGNRVHEFCCGPCTCTDMLAGALCTCNSQNDSLLAACDCGMPWITILCDIGLYAFLGISILSDYRKDQEKKERELAKKRHQDMIENAKKERESLKIQLLDVTEKVGILRQSYRDAESDVDATKRLSAMFSLMGSRQDFTRLIQLSEKQCNAGKKDYTDAEAERARIEQKIASLNRRLENE